MHLQQLVSCPSVLLQLLLLLLLLLAGYSKMKLCHGCQTKVVLVSSEGKRLLQTSQPVCSSHLILSGRSVSS